LSFVNGFRILVQMEVHILWTVKELSTKVLWNVERREKWRLGMSISTSMNLTSAASYPDLT
jgi:hypothetical protein